MSLKFNKAVFFTTWFCRIVQTFCINHTYNIHSFDYIFYSDNSEG